MIAGNTLLYGATSGEVYLCAAGSANGSARGTPVRWRSPKGGRPRLRIYMTGGRVVVLGRTGRNMAAGMSGGIAYVLGLDPAKVNTAMVALQRPDPDDLVWLHDAVTRHARFTGSTLARSVLSDWPRRSAQFTKIMPTDYQKVLEATRMAKAEDVTSIRRSWRRLVADPTGFLRVAKVEAPKRPVDERVGGLA